MNTLVVKKIKGNFAYRVLKVNEIFIQNNDKTESIFFWFRRDLVGR
jgi:hypothetical protein